MDSIEVITRNEVKNLQEKLAGQDEKICDLIEKLSLYKEEMTIKDELQIQFNELYRWIEEAKINIKQINTEYLNIRDCQLKRLEKYHLSKMTLLAEHHRLNNFNKFLKKKLKALLRTEKKLNVDLEHFETYKKNLENEYNAKNESYENSRRAVEKLTTRLERERDEATGARNRLEECQTAAGRLMGRHENLRTDGTAAREQLEECQTAGRRLEARCRELEAGTVCARSRLDDAKSLAAAAEARLEAATVALVGQIERRALELQQAEAECAEATRHAADRRCAADRSKALAAELRAACERERRETAGRERRLERDARRRCEDARRLGERLAAARADGGGMAREAAAHETRARAYEKVLESVRQSADARDSVHDEVRERLELSRAALTRDARQTTATVVELERQAGRLRDLIDGRAGAEPAVL